MSKAFVKSTKPIVTPTRGDFRIGYVPLIDAAPLLVAEERGLFRKAGLDVRLSAELGWGSIREKIVYDELDAAHAPGGLLFSILLGTLTRPRPVSTDLVINLGGNAITLSRRFWEKGVRDAASLRLTLRGEAPRRPTFAVASAHSSHPFLLREWLRSCGLHPDRDVRTVVLPPPLVGEHLRAGLIDGFCVGEPWNSQAALAGDGWIIATSGSIAPNHPEKVLMMRDSVRAKAPGACQALRAALIKACKFCDDPANRPAVAQLLHERRIFPGLSEDTLRNSLVGPFQTGVPKSSDLPGDLFRFYRGSANAATHDRAEWCLDALAESNPAPLDSDARRLCFDAFLEPDLITKNQTTRTRQLVTA